MSDLQPIAYKARRYHAGSSNAEPISIVVHDDEFHFTDSAGAKTAIPMHDVSLKLGGSSSDRVVLEFPQNGDTVIVNDLDFLKVVKKAQATSVITRQVKRAETARVINKLQGLVFAGVVAGSVLMFGGCLFVAIVLAPEDQSSETKSTETAPKVQTKEEAAQFMKVETAYQKQIKGILLAAWPAPPKDDYSTVVVEIKLAKDGTVRSTRLTQSSNNKTTDANALAAVQKSSPLPAPPSHWTEPIVLSFTFNPLDKPTKTDVKKSSQPKVKKNSHAKKSKHGP